MRVTCEGRWYYRPGYHRTQIDHQRTCGVFDYSSFTRMRIVASKGTWDGSNPVEEKAQRGDDVLR